MKRKWFCFSGLAIGVLVMLAGCGSDKKPAAPEFNHEVIVASVNAAAGSKVQVDITVSNETAITGVEVPLRLKGSDFLIDSSSYAGGRFQSCLVNSCTIDSAAQTAIMLVADLSTVSAGEGLFARLFVSLGEDAGGQTIDIDTCFIIVGQYAHVLSFASAGYDPIFPSFVPGKIIVE